MALVESHPSARAWLKSALFVALLLALVFLNAQWFASVNGLHQRSGLWLSIYALKTAIECFASVFAMFYLLVALSYRPLRPPDRAQPAPPISWRNVALVYLCCDDMQESALENLAAFCSRTAVRMVLHDDSSSPAARQALDGVARRLRLRQGLEVQVLGRTVRRGGKPGAVNHAMEALGAAVEYILLCDSDSFLWADERSFARAMSLFDEPTTAVVQFRNVGVTAPADSVGYRVLSESVDFYDAFVSFMDRFGWSPFLGHNALLRLSAVREVGGFTPGQLADDIDLSVKLRLVGYRVRYARFVLAGERHPVTYSALRARTEKWAYGCTQILRRWGLSVCLSPALGIGEKSTFFLTVSYYHFQALLLFYLAIFYVVLPFNDASIGSAGSLLVSAGLILLLTFLPSMTWFLRGRRLSSWPRAVIIWGLTYGSQDFVILGAILRCLLGRCLAWVPTNATGSTQKHLRLRTELGFGVAIVLVALLRHPALLLLPTTVLFAGKFLIACRLDAWMWRPRIDAATIRPSIPALPEVNSCSRNVRS